MRVINEIKMSSVEFDEREKNKVCVKNEGLVFFEKTVEFRGKIEFLRVS